MTEEALQQVGFLHATWQARSAAISASQRSKHNGTDQHRLATLEYAFLSFQ